MSLRYLSWPWVAGVLALLSLAQHGQLIWQFGSAIPSDPGDPILNTWILWWNAHHLPLTDAYWNAPAFAPAPNALALSETLLGLTWLTTPLQWLGASPLIAYNAMFVLTPVLNGMGAYWLCLTLTRRRDAALVGGLAFAFAPYHASQLSHIQIEATFFMPLALVGLHRYWQSGGRRWAALFGAALAMNGLTCGYFLLYFSVLIGLVVVWLMMARPDARKLAGVAAALVCAALVLLPIILKYNAVQDEWNLHRTMTEIETFSADLTSVTLGSPQLAIWPISTPTHRPQIAGYPGLAIVLLIAAVVFVAVRDRSPDLAAAWQRWLVRILSLLAAAVLVAGGVIYATGGVTYKVFGIAMDLGIIATLLSAGFWASMRSGSMVALYATGFVTSSLLALGPVGRVFGHRFWYKAPFSWVMQLPGFDSARTPALFSSIEIVCLAALAAFAVIRIWPDVTRRSLLAIAGIAVAIVIDGWTLVPAVPAPLPLPVTVSADLVVELPTWSPIDDAGAMYRGMSHGRPVVNGYSGFAPPHYVKLQDDLRNDCVNSLEGLRAGLSMDAVIWRSGGASAIALDAALRRLWTGASREETADVVVYRQPRTAPETDATKTSCPASSVGKP